MEKSKKTANEHLLNTIEEHSRIDSVSSESSQEAYQHDGSTSNDFFDFDAFLQATYESNYR